MYYNYNHFGALPHRPSNHENQQTRLKGYALGRHRLPQSWNVDLCAKWLSLTDNL